MNAPALMALVIAEGSRVRLRVLTDESDAIGDAAEPIDDERPRTRADCATVPRPCPWVGCRMNLFLDVSETGTIHQNHTGEPGDMPAERSCALDVADGSELTLEEIGQLLGGLSKERLRQVWRSALRRFALRGGANLARLASSEPYDQGE